jgi:orotate phosphoribosyltransferase
MVDPTARQRLREILIRESLLRGDFVLASGQKSSFYLDVRRTSMHPEGASLCAELLLDAVKDLDIAAVGGPVLGAAPLVGALAAVSFRQGTPLPTFLVRKDAKGHGTAKLLEGHFPGDRPVALIEDVVTTGASVLRALAVVQGEGATVSRMVCVVDREQGGAEAFAEQNVEFRALFRVSELLEESS